MGELQRPPGALLRPVGKQTLRSEQPTQDLKEENIPSTQELIVGFLAMVAMLGVFLLGLCLLASNSSAAQGFADHIGIPQPASHEAG